MRLERTCCALLGLVWSGCTFDTSNSAGDRRDGGEVIDAADASAPIAGFSQDFEVWKVPASGTSSGFGRSESAEGDAFWFLLDLDGNGQVELVQTADPATFTTTAYAWTEAGQDYWRVFFREGLGFSLVATRRDLPEAGLAITGFFSVQQNAGGILWDLFDITGDGHLDIIQFTEPGVGNVWYDDVEDSSYWRVFPGSTSGFLPPTSWKLPVVGLVQLKSLRSCSGNGCWTVMNLTGSVVPDLVLSSDKLATVTAWDSPSDPNWHVHVGATDGYGTSTKWTLPTHEDDNGFFATSKTGFWDTMDLNGRGALELVQTKPFPDGEAPFEESGSTYWKLFPSSTAMPGFSKPNESWLVPNGSTVFDTMNKASTREYWTTMDLNGDSILDLVHTTNPATADSSVWGEAGSRHWKVYLGGSSGFSESPISWAVPDSGTSRGFYATTESSGPGKWLTIDIDGDGKVDLVQTEDPETGKVWGSDTNEAHWRVYRQR